MLQAHFVMFSVDLLRWELQWEKHGPPNIKHIMRILSWTLASPLKLSMSLQHTGGLEEIKSTLTPQWNNVFLWLTVRSKKGYKNYTRNLKNKTLCKLNLHRGQGTGNVLKDQAGNGALHSECQASTSFCMSAACDDAVVLEKNQLLPSQL